MAVAVVELAATARQVIQRTKAVMVVSEPITARLHLQPLLETVDIMLVAELAGHQEEREELEEAELPIPMDMLILAVELGVAVTMADLESSSFVTQGLRLDQAAQSTHLAGIPITNSHHQGALHSNGTFCSN
jgi:hypothetical protein